MLRSLVLPAILFAIIGSEAFSSPIKYTAPGLGDEVKVSSANSEQYDTITIIVDKAGSNQKNTITIKAKKNPWSYTVPLSFGSGSYALSVFGLKRKLGAEHELLTQINVQNEFYAEQATTNSSVVVLHGRAHEEYHWIEICLNKESKEPCNPLFIENNSKQNWTQQIHLREGAGVYKIEVFGLHNSNMYNLENTYLGSFEVTNTEQDGNIYLQPSFYVESDNIQITQLAAQIVNGIADRMDRVLAIHDWVATNIAYDIQTYELMTKGVNPNYPITSLKVLNDKVSICAGYADLTAALLRAAKIPAKVITGNALLDTGENATWVRHAWNEFYVNGQWLSMDTTWDSGAAILDTQSGKLIFKQKLSRKYFNPSAELFAIDHIKLTDTISH